MGQSASDIRAGGAFYQLWAKDQITGVLNKIEKRTAAFSSVMQRTGNRAALAGAGMAAPLLALFKGGMDRGADAARMSQQLGIPIELMSRLQYAAEAAGVSVDTVMNDTEGRYRDLIKNAPSIDPAQAQAAAETQKQLRDATIELQMAMLPLVETVVIYARKLGAFVKENAGALRTLVPFAIGLVAVGIAFKVLGVAALVGVAALKVVALGFTVVGAAASAAWALITGPALALAALGGLAAAAVVTRDKWGGAFKGMAGGFQEVKEVAGTAWNGITAALGKGDLALAGKIAIKTLEIAWEAFDAKVTGIWIDMKEFFLDGWNNAVDAFRAMWFSALAWLEKRWKDLNEKVRGTVDALAGTKYTDEHGNEISREEAKKRMGIDTGPTDLEVARDRADKDLVDNVAARDRARAAERADKRKGAADEIDKLKAELKGLADAAQAPGAEKLKDPALLLKRGLLGAEQVKGGFSGAALGQQLGYGDQVRKQTELLGQMNGLLKEQPGKIAVKLDEVIGRVRAP